MLKLLVSLSFILLPLLSFSQAGLAFISSERQVAVSTNFEKRIWGELRLSTNTNHRLNFNDREGVYLRPWIVGHGNILRNSQITMSLGLGIGAYDNGYYEGGNVAAMFPFALRFAPFEKAKNVYFLGELAPLTNGQDFDLATSWGVRYLFLKE